MANINLSDLFEVESQDIQSNFIKSSRQAMTSHMVSIDSEIGEPHLYRDLINLLYMADENTEFNLLINSPGGNLSSAMAVIEAIKNTEAMVRAIIVNECHSAASIIALNCAEIVVTDTAHMMIHTASYGTGGNTHGVQRHVDFSTKMINKMLQNTYSGFLSVAELEDVERGIEMWFDADEIKVRLLNQVAYKQAKIAAIEKVAAKEKPSKVPRKTAKKSTS